MAEAIKVQSNSVEETRAFASAFAGRLQADDVVLLQGDLGTGKTLVSQEISKALGCRDTATSPTFTLVQEYGGGSLPVYHVDLYRLESLRDMESLGLEEYFDGGGVTLVEWAERLEEAGLPAPAGSWRIRIRRLDENRRELEVEKM